MDALSDLIQSILVWKFHRHISQTDCIGRRWRCTFTLPGIQPNMMVIPTRRNKRHAEGFCYAHHVKADDAVIEIDGFLDITHMQMDMSHARLGRNGLIEAILLTEIFE